jgi:hypothetical protein
MALKEVLKKRDAADKEAAIAVNKFKDAKHVEGAIHRFQRDVQDLLGQVRKAEANEQRTAHDEKQLAKIRGDLASGEERLAKEVAKRAPNIGQLEQAGADASRIARQAAEEWSRARSEHTKAEKAAKEARDQVSRAERALRDARRAEL